MIVPKDVSGPDLVFGGTMKDLLPPYAEIPTEYRDGKTPWNALVSQWFFRGLGKVKFHAKNGIDAEKAFRHLKAIMSSWEPKHEHKEAGVAYLMSLWFESVSEEGGAK